MLIYRIFNETHNYIGSTVDLKNRMSVHKCPTNKYRCSSKIIIDSGNYQVEILEECEDKDREIREQFWIDSYDCVNRNNPVAKKDWDKRNKEKMKLWKKKDKEYKDSWGGDKRNNNNLLLIDINLFA